MESQALKSLIVRLADEEEIIAQSGGEVTVDALLDDDGKSVPGGLFDPSIFGKDGTGMGHITLARPMVHPWYEEPVRLILGTGDIEDGTRVIGMLKDLDLKHRLEELQVQYDKQSFSLKCIETLVRTGMAPERFVLTVLPVAPPSLRPILQTSGAAVSMDLNELYRRVVARNNALKSLIRETGGEAPGVYFKDSVSRLFNAIEALIGFEGSEGPLQHLTDLLKAQNGFLKRNLEGKRQDYSGRCVIASGPELNLRQCGIPVDMALEIFKPFVSRKMVDNGSAANVYEALRQIASSPQSREVQTALEQTAVEKIVLLNRAPTLSRLSIQPFEPVLADSKSILLHPLTCYAFNADFDGDQMAVHLPISDRAQSEVKGLLESAVSLISPANGKPSAAPVQDIVLGLWYLTYAREGDTVSTYTSANEVLEKLHSGEIHPHTPLFLKDKSFSSFSELETAAGRVLFNSFLPEEVRYVNAQTGRNGLVNLVERVLERCGPERTRQLLDDLNRLGFEYATLYAPSYGMGILPDPEGVRTVRESILKQDRTIREKFAVGDISEDEYYDQLLSKWAEAVRQAGDAVINALSSEDDGLNPLYAITESGARGGRRYLELSFGIAGMTWKETGADDRPVFEAASSSNYWNGFGALEHFQRTFGARKSLMDAMLRSFDALSLMRRLILAVQDILITCDDCGTTKKTRVSAVEFNGKTVERLSRRIRGRVSAEDVKDSDGSFIIRAGELISSEQAARVDEAGIPSVSIRSVLDCQAGKGICAKCYGEDLASKRLVKVGTAVGVIAAQAAAEPAVQLTYRTFYPPPQSKTQYDPDNFPGGMNEMIDLFSGRMPELSAQEFIERNQQILGFQGGDVDDKHFEILARRLYGFMRVEDAGDTSMLEGDIVRHDVFAAENNAAVEAGKRPASGTPVVLGDNEAAAKSSSVIGSAAVGNTVETLALAAVKGARDDLESPLERIVAGLAPKVVS